MRRLAHTVVFAAVTVWAQDTPTVSVTGGQVRGAALPYGAVFKGIPFAAPPVGDLRWREPQPVKPWTGVRDSTMFSPRCVQGGADVSEDCLYLMSGLRSGRRNRANL